jgi:hypothetical protein
MECPCLTLVSRRRLHPKQWWRQSLSAAWFRTAPFSLTASSAMDNGCQWSAWRRQVIDVCALRLRICTTGLTHATALMTTRVTCVLVARQCFVKVHDLFIVTNTVLQLLKPYRLRVHRTIRRRRNAVCLKALCTAVTVRVRAQLKTILKGAAAMSSCYNSTSNTVYRIGWTSKVQTDTRCTMQ